MVAPTALPASTRFFQPEISKVYWMPTVAAANHTPTRAEITAGKDLTGEIAALSGWTIAAGMIAVADLGSRFTRQISGRTSAENSSITFWASKDGQDVRTVLTRLLAGYVLFADGGDVAAQPADVFPVQVTSVGKVRSVGDQGFQLTVGFAITGVPGEDIVLPALT